MSLLFPYKANKNLFVLRYVDSVILVMLYLHMCHEHTHSKILYVFTDAEACTACLFSSLQSNT